ncbi:MAG: CTP synthase [Methylobacter tundripaludum]|nr:CTP synthase [Methylobacter tundripaludum]
MIKAIALLGEYTPTFPPHISTDAAIRHARNLLNVEVAVDWVSTEDISPTLFEQYSGIWVAPGSPYKSMELTLWAIRYARENKIPCFGTCGGFQHMVIEYARNVLGFKDAQHAEYDPYASSLFISQLACSLAGREMQLNFAPDSQVATIYGSLSAKEHYYCNFGVNPDCIDELKQGPLNVSGADAEGEIRVIEHPDHPFFIGTLFVPQARSAPEGPHPLVTAFLEAVVRS